MPFYKGFVDSIHVRDDGWVETAIKAVHAGNAIQLFFIPNLDGPVEQLNRRLACLSLLRDALLRVLPIEIEYRDDAKGRLIDAVTVHPRPSIDGLTGSSSVS